jgi:hypothetical protein
LPPRIYDLEAHRHDRGSAAARCIRLQHLGLAPRQVENGAAEVGLLRITTLFSSLSLSIGM